MWPRTNLTTNRTWRIGALALGVSLYFASSLAAQQAPQGQQQPPDRDAYAGAPQAQQQPQDYGVPQTLTIPAGGTITGHLSQYLSSHQNRPGDPFTMTLAQPLVVNGWVVARAGQLVHGEVTVANKGGGSKGPSQLGIEVTELNFVDGQQVPVTTQMIQSTGSGRDIGRDVATVATTTVLGTVIGGAIGRGTGAAIGAGVGATAGIAGVMSTPGKPTELFPETMITFRLSAPVDISTQGSERAFLPVSPQDYGNANGQARARYNAPPPPRPYVAPYGPPYPYPYPYAYAYPYGYPYYYGPSIGIGIGIGIRPYGYYGGFRGGFRGRR